MHEEGFGHKKLLEERIEILEKKLKNSAREGDDFNSTRYSDLLISQQDEFNLLEILSDLWEGKWIILATTLLTSIMAIFYSLSIPAVFRSDALLAPASKNIGSVDGLASQFGGLASLAGLNLGGGSGDKTTLAIEVLHSREFLSKFIQKHELLVPLMAAKGWNRQTNSLVLDEDIYDVNSGKWIRKVDPPHSPEPSIQEAYREFVRIFSVSENKKTRFVTLSVEFYSPFVTKEWVELLITDINAEIQMRDKNEALKSISYLQAQLLKTPLTQMQSIFYELIEDQTKNLMIAEVREEYVFKVVDGPIVPDKKFKPNRSLVCVLGFILGGLVGVIIVLGRKQFKSLKDN